MDGSTRRAEAWLTGREPTMAGRRRGQIKARGAGAWLIRISLPTDATGKRRTWNKTIYGTRKEAERALTRALSALDNGRLEDPSRMPLADWLEEWMESKRQDLRERSWLSYREWIDIYLLPALGHIPLADLKPRDVQKATIDLAAGKFTRGKPLGPVTIRNAIGRLRSALSAAVKLRLIPNNPASDAALPRVNNRGPKRVLSVEEAARFMQVVRGHRLASFFLLTLGTGLRPGEAMGLLWEDFDQGAALLHVRRSLWNRRKGKPAELTPPKNRTSVRSIPLSPDLVALLKRHKAHQAADRLAAGKLWQDRGLIFARPDGRPMSDGTARQALSTVLKRAGLENLTLHGLRHSAATLLIEAGIDASAVARQLGHSSVKTTLDTYVKTSEQRLREGSELLSQILFREDRIQKGG